ncbi:carbohydrate ABC transporter permease [Kribbella solani]|uniref:carbohydrate ABC transporter permease n=1 Tax=Kribbella solani TaxID=236067 RepID=UPI0029A16FB6|nr:carbohydrate ABC transporter permease [Kribbella solani]MDX3005559.1 carbohydrate ABC transporter permease [Kribbella solani]
MTIAAEAVRPKPAKRSGPSAPKPADRKGLGRFRLADLGSGLIVLYCLVPFYWMIVSALRKPSDQFATTLFPAPISFENMKAAFSARNGFGRALLNSLIVAGTTTVITLAIGITTAYVIARVQFRFKNVVLAVIIATSMFPGVTLLIPLLKLFVGLDWINTYQALIVPSLSFGLPLTVFNLTAFFKQLPAELEDAAQVDGCSQWQGFRSVILPLAMPGIFTSGIITFIAAWNEFIIALSLTNEKSMRTAPVITALFTGQYKFDQPFGTQMAAGVAVTVPLVIGALLFQRRIVDGLTAGALK